MDQNNPQTSIPPPVIPVAKAERVRLAALFTVIFSGFALLSDGYQVGVLSIVNVALHNIYGDQYTTQFSTSIGNGFFVGCIVGQLSFGLVCDRFGRKVGLMITTLLVILGAALCAGTYAPTVEGFFWMLTAWRVVIGLGVGGEYPCSSSSASEGANEVMPDKRGMLFVMVTNFVIDLGFVVSALVPLILAACGLSDEAIWRTSFALGVLPPLSVFYFRLKMDNSELYKASAMKKRVPYVLIVKRYWRSLLASGGIWFFYNFVALPFGLFSGTIISQGTGADQSIFKISQWMLLLNSFYLPGAVSGALICDKLGRKRTMALGFVCQGILGIFLGVYYRHLITNMFPLFVVLYGCFLMFGEMGPGDMIGLVSAEIYPTAIRGSAYGLSAAMGKLGALVGTAVFKPLILTLGQGDEVLGEGRTFIVASCLSLVAVALTLGFIPDHANRNLKQEDDEFRQYLTANGFDISQIGDETTDAANEKKTAC